ncbi:ORF101 [black bullhead herpesvirus]|uniref:ORF101 n=1 Tax=black bullhead herpesvirus TaxID=508441 RepID=A0A2H5AJJ3_9VIRU|nr:ORF101 [black bullhead herpesvirus]AUG72326.1 ORF101 [black bullhead herpesvirus]
MASKRPRDPGDDSSGDEGPSRRPCGRGRYGRYTPTTGGSQEERMRVWAAGTETEPLIINNEAGTPRQPTINLYEEILLGPVAREKGDGDEVGECRRAETSEAPGTSGTSGGRSGPPPLPPLSPPPPPRLVLKRALHITQTQEVTVRYHRANMMYYLDWRRREGPPVGQGLDGRHHGNVYSTSILYSTWGRHRYSGAERRVHLPPLFIPAPSFTPQSTPGDSPASTITISSSEEESEEESSSTLLSPITTPDDSEGSSSSSVIIITSGEESTSSSTPTPSILVAAGEGSSSSPSVIIITSGEESTSSSTSTPSILLISSPSASPGEAPTQE